MTRVAVIGNAGGGKSTLCRALSAAYDLPHHAVDKVQWRPGWVKAPDDEIRAWHDAMLGSERWIIDGFGPWPCIEQRFAAADTIIFIDHPLWLHYWWATKRQVKSILWGRPDGPEGCPMWPVIFRLFRVMWHVHQSTRPRLLILLDHHRLEKDVIHIRTPRELHSFVRLYQG